MKREKKNTNRKYCIPVTTQQTTQKIISYSHVYSIIMPLSDLMRDNLNSFFFIIVVCAILSPAHLHVGTCV